MAKENTTKRAQKIATVGVVCFLAAFGFLLVLGLANQWIVAGIIVGILIILGIVLLIVSEFVEKKYAGKDKIKGKETESINEENTDTPEMRNSRALIWKFDAFVRDNFRELPLEPWSDAGLQGDIQNKIIIGYLTADDLRPIVNSMIKHLGQTFNYAQIEVNLVPFNTEQKPGFINEGTHKIVVNYCIEMDFLNVYAILAHEVAHAFQFYEFSKYPGDELETEKFTDFLTVYLGFGKYTQSWREYKKYEDNKIYKNRLGYLDDYSVSFAFQTAKARREMKNIQEEENSKIDVLKNKAVQIEQVFPQYLSFIKECTENFAAIKIITSESFALISEAMMEIDSLKEEKVSTLIEKIKNSNFIEEAEKNLIYLNIEIHKWYKAYIKFSEISDKI